MDYILYNRYNTIAGVHDCPKITDHSVISVTMSSNNNNNCGDNIVRFRILSIENLD